MKHELLYSVELCTPAAGWPDHTQW